MHMAWTIAKADPPRRGPLVTRTCTIAAWFCRLDERQPMALRRAIHVAPEALPVVALFGLVIFLLRRPGFDGFFHREDFEWLGVYRQQMATFSAPSSDRFASCFISPPVTQGNLAFKTLCRGTPGRTRPATLSSGGRTCSCFMTSCCALPPPADERRIE